MGIRALPDLKLNDYLTEEAKKLAPHRRKKNVRKIQLCNHPGKALAASDLQITNYHFPFTIASLRRALVAEPFSHLAIPVSLPYNTPLIPLSPPLS